MPFAALTQQPGGSATWNPRFLLGIQFVVGPGAAFDVWVDDIRFYLLLDFRLPSHLHRSRLSRDLPGGRPRSCGLSAAGDRLRRGRHLVR